MRASFPSETTDADALPVDGQTIQATLDRAQAIIDGPLPRYEVLDEVERLLHGHIQLLLPGTLAAAGKLPPGCTRDSRRARLDAVRWRLDRDLGRESRAALIQVQCLACDCKALLDWAWAPPPCPDVRRDHVISSHTSVSGHTSTCGGAVW